MNIKIPKAQCNSCTLINNPFVPSEINNSKMCLVAEAPGYIETLQGKPLVGQAGKDLELIIKELGKERKDFSLLNVCCCRPLDGNKNRTPTELEITCCKFRLFSELKIINPIAVVAMGKVPYLAFGGNPKTLMKDVVGSHFSWESYEVFITYHPAAIVHSGGINSSVGKIIKDKIKEQIKNAIQYKPEPRQLRML